MSRKSRDLSGQDRQAATTSVAYAQDAQSAWSRLSAHYQRICNDLATLNGQAGTEAASDVLFDEFQQVIRQLSMHRALTRQHIQQKLNAALTMMDEAEDDTARQLIASAISDLQREP